MRIWGPLNAAVCGAVFAGAAAAERVDCAFVAPCLGAICAPEAVTLSFEIDPNQFVAPQAKGEPPRGKVTLVRLGEHVFEAEPIRMADGTRGFHAEVAGVEHLMTTRPDGMGSYATSGAVPFMSGRCEVSR